jgi:hypothetical protein
MPVPSPDQGCQTFVPETMRDPIITVALFRAPGKVYPPWPASRGLQRTGATLDGLGLEMIPPRRYSTVEQYSGRLLGRLGASELGA